MGTVRSNCAPPCTSTEITSVFLDEKKDNFPQSRIGITFSDQVSIVVTNFPKFDAAYLLSACGGSMGMWLGVGVVHILQMLGKIILKIKINKKQVQMS